MRVYQALHSLAKMANQDLVFELSPDLIQALNPFIHSFEFTPQA